MAEIIQSDQSQGRRVPCRREQEQIVELAGGFRGVNNTNPLGFFAGDIPVEADERCGEAVFAHGSE